MRIFDVPEDYIQGNPQCRIAVIGTCRVLDPIEHLANAQEVIRVWAHYNFATYTLGEAVQALQFILNEGDIPQNFWRLIIDDPSAMPPREKLHRRLLESVDSFIIEVSELSQLRNQNTYFQPHVFFRNFISKYGAAIQQWYRSLSLGQPISEELIRATLAALPQLQPQELDDVEAVLRNTRLELADIKLVTKAIGKICFKSDTKWMFVSHFVVPGIAGTSMQDRIKLRDTLQEATVATGTEFFDPSELVTRYGRETALAKGGRDIIHYDPTFHEIVGHELLRRAIDIDKRKNKDPRRETYMPADNARYRRVSTTASDLNGVLVDFHRERLARLGLEESGLYDAYASRLTRNEIIDRQALEVANMVMHHLPAYDCCHVLRAGLGEIGFLLAALGQNVVAFDPFPRRFGAIEAGFQHLKKLGMLAPERFRPGEVTVVPEVDKSRRVLAIAAQLQYTGTDEQEETLLQKLEFYSGLIFNPSSLFHHRPMRADQEAVIDRFRKCGFTSVREYPALRLVYCERAGLPPVDDERRFISTPPGNRMQATNLDDKSLGRW